MHKPVLSLLVALLPGSCITSPGTDSSDTHVLLLRHVSAAEVAPILEEVLRPCCCGRTGQTIALAEVLTVGVSLRVVADPTRNALLVSGTDEQVREVRDLVLRLDLPPQ